MDKKLFYNIYLTSQSDDGDLRETPSYWRCNILYIKNIFKTAFYPFLLWEEHRSTRRKNLVVRLRSTNLKPSAKPRIPSRVVEVRGANDDHYANLTRHLENLYYFKCSFQTLNDKCFTRVLRVGESFCHPSFLI